jgi:hypothetical protein
MVLMMTAGWRHGICRIDACRAWQAVLGRVRLAERVGEPARPALGIH